jgi:hypothetical protein
MPRDVATRWNSTYDMLKFALTFREALDTITGEKDMKLRKYEMDEEEWEIACQLREVLKVGPDVVYCCSLHLSVNQVFKDATLFFSRDGIPNLATVIPAMGHIDEVLKANIVDQKYSGAIRAALTLGRQTLARYYTKTDL